MKQRTVKRMERVFKAYLYWDNQLEKAWTYITWLSEPEKYTEIMLYEWGWADTEIDLDGSPDEMNKRIEVQRSRACDCRVRLNILSNFLSDSDDIPF